MITMEEILRGAKFDELSPEIQANLLKLHEKINILRKAYGKPIRVNDGLRLSPGTGAKNSTHLRGLAIDLDDDDSGTLWFWIMQNMDLIQELGIYLEHGCWTHANGKSWVHCQVVAPLSKHRIFIPNLSPNPNPPFWDGKYDPKYDS